MGLAAGLPAPADRGLERQPQAGATDLARGGAAAAPAAHAEALTTRRRLQRATQSRVPAPRLGDRLPVRPDDGWQKAEILEYCG